MVVEVIIAIAAAVIARAAAMANAVKRGILFFLLGLLSIGVISGLIWLKELVFNPFRLVYCQI